MINIKATEIPPPPLQKADIKNDKCQIGIICRIAKFSKGI